MKKTPTPTKIAQQPRQVVLATLVCLYGAAETLGALDFYQPVDEKVCLVAIAAAHDLVLAAESQLAGLEKLARRAKR